ncbi:penicillin-binding protein 2 [Aquibaculum arenosum]|uniref:Penicillin-binding protein 2 n=1 Tax=Aquibaculum arenosum TaxID=3032591 RepID=A0ABT5YPQ0_9PROT|nr:penicillin-binding protein 2 [Fodinicurvata sp. CAU 1616]MDF2096951.1 penicillin-binding protein 2 [Fodinicurvata sp. CAU 1616]
MERSRNEEQTRYSSFSRRSLLLGGGMLLGLGTLVGRLYQLQVVEAERYRLLAENNRISMRLLAPPRGEIIDRQGIPVAINRQNYQVLLVAEQARNYRQVLDRLGGIVEITEADRERIDRDVSRVRSFVPVRVRDNLSWDQVSRIAVNAPELPGISIEVGETRHYPFGAVLSHILGYVAAVSERDLIEQNDPLLQLPGLRIGKSGIERTHDETLRGAAGTSQVEVNAVGRVMQELTREEGQPGHMVELTVDTMLQNYAQQRLMGERSASAVVLDVTNGDVLAMASVPSYDPEPFGRGLTAAQWRALTEDPLNPLSNKCIAGAYAPGSTFKMVVALAAMEQGIDPGERVFCPGYYELGNHRFHCWSRGGHGHMNLQDSLIQSCDVYYYDVARRLGIERIAAMARRLGMGVPVGIDLPGEREGLVPTEDWKLATIGERWQGGETLISAIGQGFMLSTPLQLAVMTARLVNGGRAVVPHVTRAIHRPGGIEPTVKAPPPSLGIPERHLDIVVEAMEEVVLGRRGTARGARIDLPGLEMGGKTGTSQVRRISAAERAAGVFRNEDLPWHRRDHALFVGFAPVGRPRYACAVVVAHGGGGSAVAAPIARDLLIETQRRDPASREGPSGPIAALGGQG